MKTILLFGLICVSSFALVGGKKAAIGQFPSVVLIADCTATKIGEYHFLLAAHCVVQPGGEEETYANQVKLEFSEGVSLALDRAVEHSKGQSSHSLRIARTFVHPAYRYSSVEHAWLKPQAISDVAIIVVNEKTPEIPVMALGAEPLKPGESVTKVGYGCPETVESQIHSWVISGARTLHFGMSTIAESASGLATYYSTAKKSKKELAFYSTGKVREFIVGSFALTRGKYHALPPKNERDKGDAKEVSLGFSDSGGPLLAERKGKWMVVGVNAKSLLWPVAEHETKLVPVALDLHTRLDREGFSGTHAWLEAILALSPVKAKNRPALGGPFTDVVDPSTWKKPKEPPLTKEYLREEAKSFVARLTTASGKPCALSLAKLTLYDLNNEENRVFALEPDDEEEELPLKATGPGQWKVTAPQGLIVESVLLELRGKKTTADDSACLFRLE